MGNLLLRSLLPKSSCAGLLPPSRGMLRYAKRPFLNCVLNLPPVLSSKYFICFTADSACPLLWLKYALDNSCLMPFSWHHSSNCPDVNCRPPSERRVVGHPKSLNQFSNLVVTALVVIVLIGATNG